MNIAEFLAPEAWMNPGTGPRYKQLRHRIEHGIDTGAFAPGAPLPAEREIGAITGLSRVTVRKAMQELVDCGRIVQRQGSGSFVRDAPPHVEQSLSRLTSFSQDMERRGHVATSVWLEREVVVPAPAEVLALALSPGDLVARIARLRRADDRPMAIERAALPTDILPDPRAVGASLYDHLELAGHRPIRAMQKISAISIDGPDAALLEVPEGAAGLRIERTSYMASGRVAEFTRSLYRGDAYDFVAELRLAEG